VRAACRFDDAFSRAVQFDLPPLAMRFLLLLSAVVLTGCVTNPNRCEDSHPTDPASQTFAPSLNVNLSQMTKSEVGVYTQDIVVGSGDKLLVPRLVSVFYAAFLVDGTLVDQSLQQTFQFDLRTNAALGLVDGMMGMNTGGRRLIVVPSDLALGACRHGSIPANSTLVYQIELVSIEP
jgi:FKBP-type peptidyl-prolyl cis-trans isomerase FkpA